MAERGIEQSQRRDPAVSARGWLAIMLGAALICMGGAIVSMFVARADLLEAGRWVQHTSDVQLAISACRIHVREAQLDVPHRGDALREAWRDAERMLELTVDNPAQQTRIGRFLPPLRAFTGDAPGRGPDRPDPS